MVTSKNWEGGVVGEKRAYPGRRRGKGGALPVHPKNRRTSLTDLKESKGGVIQSPE